YIYASQSKNWILIETERKNYIVSPENLDIIDVINKWYYLQFSGYWSTFMGHCPEFCVNRKLQDSGFIFKSHFQI
ncbi:PH domain-containing protein, partial [Bacteroides fragilis]